MTSSYTIADFQVQYWTGAQWVAVPGGSVTGNRNIWRKFVFTPVTTTAIRVLVTRSQVTFSRIAGDRGIRELHGSSAANGNV